MTPTLDAVRREELRKLAEAATRLGHSGKAPVRHRPHRTEFQMTDSQHEVERLSDERLRELMTVDKDGWLIAPTYDESIVIVTELLAARALLHDINRKTTPEGK